MQLLCGRGTTQWHLHVWFNRTIHNFLFASVIPKSGFRSIWYDEKLPHLHCSWPLHQRVFLKIKLLRSTLAPGKKNRLVLGWNFVSTKNKHFIWVLLDISSILIVMLIPYHRGYFVWSYVDVFVNKNCLIQKKGVSSLHLRSCNWVAFGWSFQYA